MYHSGPWGAQSDPSEEENLCRIMKNYFQSPLGSEGRNTPVP